MAETGLRDRKKLQTRTKLIDVAQSLFRKQGYEETTVEQIAAAADVAPRTFFRYFTNKEDLVLLGQDAENEQIMKLVRERPAGEAPLDTLVRGAAMLVEWTPQTIEQARRSRKLLRETPALRIRQHGLLAEAKDLLAEGLTPKHASKAEALRIRVLCAAFLASLDTVMNAWLDGDGKGTPQAQVQWVAQTLRSGFGD